jgi:octaprenyl-diphosphate synthase
MKPIEKIKNPINEEMRLFEDKFKQSMGSSVPLLDRITHYIVRRKGKQMRPMFVFLTAKVLSGQVSEKAYRAASLIELLHTATLVHDDVVDDSNMRRGFFSLNALWKNKIAVLVGDFLLSKGLLLSVENKDFDLLEIVSTAVKEMSEGELLQIEKARKLDITEEVYFDIIKKKTATLIAACTASGALSTSADQALVNNFKQFGELLGIAFQIKDDLFDYTEDKIGKPTGIDIQEQKMTLPLIYTLNKVDRKSKKWIIDIVKNQNKNKKKVKELIKFVKDNGGIEYTTKRMKEYQEKALKILEPIQESPAKESLITLVNYVINRNI